MKVCGFFISHNPVSLKVASIIQKLLLEAEVKHRVISFSSVCPTALRSFPAYLECYSDWFSGSGLYFDNG